MSQRPEIPHRFEDMSGILFRCSIKEKKLPTKNGVASKFMANFCLCSTRKKNSTKNGVATKSMANFCLRSIRKKLSTKNGVATKFMATFYLCSIRKKHSTKYGVATKFMANFCLCCIRKTNFLPKLELLQNLWQMWDFSNGCIHDFQIPYFRE